MNSIFRHVTLSFAIGFLNSVVFCQEKDDAETKAAKYVIFSKPEDVQLGTPVQVPQWTKEYQHLIREICMNFHARHPEVFKVIERELAKPGKNTIDLAELKSTEGPFSKDFHFRFDKPTKLTFEFTHPGRLGVMMMFRGGNGADTKRLDTMDGAPLQIDVEVSAKDIQEAGGKYWVLDILNFGTEAVSCELDLSSSQ